MIIRRIGSVVALVLGFSGLSFTTLVQDSKPQPPKNLRSIALQAVAKKTGRPVERLIVVNSTQAEYPLQGTTTQEFKVMDDSGNIHGISLNARGQAVNSGQIRAAEQVAEKSRNGKLAPGLAKKLATVSDNEPVQVILWLKDTSPAPTRPAPNSRGLSSPAQANAVLAEVNSQRAATVTNIVTPVAEKVKNFDKNAQADKYAPVVYATLRPQEIRQLAQLGEVDQVYEDLLVEPTLDISRQTIYSGSNIDSVNNLGLTGSGVRVAQIEVGGRIATNNPFISGTLQDSAYVCSSPNTHATGVAGIIRSTHSKHQGIASGVELWAGGSCVGRSSELQNRSTAAADWGASIFNLSLGSDTNRTLTAFDRFYDNMVINYARTVVVAAGNNGGSSCAQGTNGNVGSPGLAYNVVTVGNFNDSNTVSWSGDAMNQCSSWRNPISTNGDREKPEIVAPGTNINSTTNASPWSGNIGSGTSYAAPMVAGVAALMMQRNSNLVFWPEAIKAILMTTATHNIEGNTRLSEYDGAGGLVSKSADEVARGVNGNWGAQDYSCSAANSLDIATVSLTGGVRTRATIAWNNDPNYSSYTSQPSTDLDFQIINSAGTVVAQSGSYDNTYEIIDFTPSSSGNYRLRVNKFRCDYSPRYLGWAWRQGN